MFEGLADKIKNGGVPTVPKTTLPTKKTGGLFSDLAEKVKAKQAQAPTPALPPPETKVSLLNPLAIPKAPEKKIVTTEPFNNAMLRKDYVAPAPVPTLSEQPIKPDAAPKGIVDFAKRTVASTASQVADTAKFAADYIAKRPSAVLQAVNPTVFGALRTTKVGEVLNKTLDNAGETVLNKVNEKGLNPYSAAQKVTKEFSDKVNVNSPEWERAPLKEKLTTKLPETIYNIAPSIAGSLIPYLAGPEVGFAVSAGSVAEDVKDKALKSGVNPRRAEELGLVTGLAVGYIDKIVPSKQLEGAAKEEFTKGFLKRLAKTSFEEAGTEVAQENIQLAAEATFRDDLGWDEVKTRNAMSALGGLLGGAGINGAVDIAFKGGPGSFSGVLDINTAKPNVNAETLPIAGIDPAKMPDTLTAEQMQLLQEQNAPKTELKPGSMPETLTAEQVQTYQTEQVAKQAAKQAAKQVQTEATKSPKVEAMKQYLESNGIKTNANNTVTVYHVTTPEIAAKITESGELKTSTGSPNGQTGVDLKDAAYAGYDKQQILDTWGGTGRAQLVAMDVPVEDVRHGAKNLKEFYFEGGLKRGADGIWRPPFEPQSTFVDRQAMKKYQSQTAQAVPIAPQSNQTEAATQETVNQPAAEEGLKLYHGTASEFDVFDLSKTGLNKSADWGEGVYLTPDKNNANRYAQDASLNTKGKPLVKEFSLSPKAKMKNVFLGPSTQTNQNLSEELRANGFDGAKIFNGPRGDEDTFLSEVIIINPEMLFQKPAETITEQTKLVPRDEKMESAVFKRLQAEDPNVDGEATYTKKNQAEQTSKAIDLVATDKNKAYRIAMGIDETPSDLTSTVVNIALAEKAREEGNYKLYSELVIKRSLEQTRRGQEIVAEKGSVSDNSLATYTKKLIAARLEKVGEKYTSGIQKQKNRKKSSKSLAMEVIENQANDLSERVNKAREFNLAEVQSFIDSLAC